MIHSTRLFLVSLFEVIDGAAGSDRHGILLGWLVGWGEEEEEEELWR